MRMVLLGASIVAASALAQHAGAQGDSKCVVDIRGNQVCGTRAGECVLDRYRNAQCAQANGSILTDRYGEVVCGAGACTTDINGVIRCAAAAGGSVSTSPSGEISCDGGCVVASSAACRSGPAN